MKWKPCPFCGGTDIRTDKHSLQRSSFHHEVGEPVYSMCCYRCGATFPNRFSLKILNEQWNRRVKD